MAQEWEGLAPALEWVRAATEECVNEWTQNDERHARRNLKPTSNIEATDLKPAEFSCHAPDAQSVFVAGTFNDWNPVTLPLDRQADGHWRTVVPLPAGHHEFKFIVDGQWCCEPGCEHEYQGCQKCCANELGTMNRVLEVS